MIFLLSASLLVSNTISPAQAAAYSLVLPGLGDVKLGRKRGYAFMAAEGLTWAGWAWFRWNAYQRRNAAQGFACLYAGANREAMSEDYLLAMEDWPSRDAYDEHILEEARYNYPDNPDSQKIYVEEHSLPDECTWEWEDEEKQTEYREIRFSERKNIQHAANMIAVAIFNRMISALLSSLPVKNKPSGIYLLPERDGLSMKVEWRVPW